MDTEKILADIKLKNEEFKLNDNDAEASFFGEPEIAPRPQGFPF